MTSPSRFCPLTSGTIRKGDQFRFRAETIARAPAALRRRMTRRWFAIRQITGLWGKPVIAYTDEWEFRRPRV